MVTNLSVLIQLLEDLRANLDFLFGDEVRLSPEYHRVHRSDRTTAQGPGAEYGRLDPSRLQEAQVAHE